MDFRPTIAAEDLAKYSDPRLDEACKELFKNKPFLAPILKACVPEFQEYDTGYLIEHCIGEPEISAVPMMAKLRGKDTEDFIPEEGQITYDIRFDAYYSDGKGKAKVILDIEVQNNYYPGYDLVTRAVYYTARLLSSQNQHEFRVPEYDGLRKVYSIWIVTKPPKMMRNSIFTYRIREERVEGSAPFKDLNVYDKLEVIMLYLGESDEAKNGILRMLEVLLSEKRTLAERKQILEHEYGIQMTEEIEGGFDKMCNYSIGIALSNYERGREEGWQAGLDHGEKQGLERGVQQGIRQGLKQGRHDLIRTALKNGGSVELVASLLGIDKNEVEKIKEGLIF